jgi:hypothetical protein
VPAEWFAFTVPSSESQKNHAMRPLPSGSRIDHVQSPAIQCGVVPASP